MTSVNPNPTTPSTAETTETAIRDRFVEYVADKNANKLTDPYSWADTDHGPVKDADAAKTINEAATGATVQDKGNTLWDANAGHLKTNIERLTLSGDATISYANLSEEQIVALDTYANISGTGTKDFAKAYNAAVEAGSADPLADAMKMVGDRIAKFSGKMAREIDAIDETVALRDGTAPADDGAIVARPAGLDDAQIALFETAAAVNTLLEKHEALSDELTAITGRIASGTASSADLTTDKARLETLKSEISTNDAALLAQKPAVDALVAGTAISAPDVELNTEGLQIGFEAATSLEPARAEQARLVDGAIAKAKQAEELAEPVSYNFPNITGTKAALAAAAKNVNNKSDASKTEYEIPESYIRGIYNPDWIDLKDNAVRGSKDDLKKEIAANKEQIADGYLTYIKDLVLEQLHAAGYSNAQINAPANAAFLESAIVSAAINAKPVNAEGKPNKVERGDADKIAGLTFDVSAGINDFMANVPEKTIGTGTTASVVEVQDFAQPS